MKKITGKMNYNKMLDFILSNFVVIALLYYFW